MLEWIIAELLKANPWMKDEATAWNYVQAMNNSELIVWIDKYLTRDKNETPS